MCQWKRIKHCRNVYDSHCHIHHFDYSLIHKNYEIPLSNLVLTLFLEKQRPPREICNYHSHGAALCYCQELNEKNNYTVRISMNFSLRSFPSITLHIPYCAQFRMWLACALENCGFFFTAGPHHGSKLSFLGKRVWWPTIFLTVT